MNWHKITSLPRTSNSKSRIGTPKAYNSKSLTSKRNNYGLYKISKAESPTIITRLSISIGLQSPPINKAPRPTCSQYRSVKLLESGMCKSPVNSIINAGGKKVSLMIINIFTKHVILWEFPLKSCKINLHG